MRCSLQFHYQYLQQYTVFCLDSSVSLEENMDYSLLFSLSIISINILLMLLKTTYLDIAAAVGVSFIQFANNNSMRNLYIVGLSLFLGISVPQYFNEFTASAGHGPAKTNAGWVS